ncbi:MAG: rubrerythrin [Spirochaetales bacterium]|nr:rubrerythrin [Spirochaetales bacterium]
MPDFGNPFHVMKSDRKLTHEELVRAVRFMVSAEYEAIQLYQELAESTDNELAKNVLIDVADEEKVHAGEFLRLLKELDPEEENFYKEGYAEVEEEFLGGASKQTEDEGKKDTSTEAPGKGLGLTD